MDRIVSLALVLAWAGSFAAAPAAHSQAYPLKPIRMVVPSPPGGGSDILGRLVAQKAGEALGQPVLIENRAGADGIIGTEYVARAAADGYTLLIGNATANVANLFLHKSLPYDPVKDFAPITGGVEAITCIAVNPSLPINSVKDLVEYAKRNPGKLTYGSSGAGGAYHMSGEAFKAITQTDIVHVPYKGLVPSLTAVIGGQISLAFNSVTVSLPQAQAGKVRIIAVIEDKRYSKLPNVPVVRESVSGFKGSTIWNGFFAPAGLPAPLLTRLNAELVKALSSADVVSKLDAAEVIGGTPEQFAAYVRGQIENFAKLVKLVGVKPQ